MEMDNAMVIENLSKAYPGFALSEVSMTLPRGSIMGFIGENGAGKTTTIKLIFEYAAQGQRFLSGFWAKII